MEAIVLEYRDLVIAIASACSVFFACIVITWPYLVPDTLGIRMKEVSEERSRIRTRERAKLKPQPGLLRPQPKQFYQRILDRFKLGEQAEDLDVAARLRMAGYRGHGPVVTYVVIRMFSPLIMLLIAGFYIFFVLDLGYPFFIRVAMTLGAALLGYYLPAIYVKNKIKKRQQAVMQAWPDALDLMLICIESGMGVESAFRKVSTEIGAQSVELAEELGLTTAELAYLQDRRTAYENLAARTGLDGVSAVVTGLIQAEKYGTPIAQTLRVLAQESRDTRMSMAEKKAAALPPKLTVPMILFFLPVLFAVIITPAAIQVMELD